MPDKTREEGFLQMFLRWYNTRTGKSYREIGRPEENPAIKGHYDFLCKDDQSGEELLAIEENRLNKSSLYGRDTKELQQMQCEVDSVLRKRGLRSGSKGYDFFVKFKRAPGKKERKSYTERIAQCIEGVILEDKDMSTREELRCQLEGCELVQDFWVIRNSAGSCIRLSCVTEELSTPDVAKAVRGALLTMFKDCDAKLKVAKNQGDKTILLVTNDWDDFLSAETRNLADAMNSIEPRCYQHIDEIFFINRQSLRDDFDIREIKPRPLCE